MAKLIHKQINVFATCKQWGTSLTKICPLCKMAPETHQHVLSCPYAPVQQARNQSIAHITKALGQMNTEPHLKEFLIQAIASFAVDYPLGEPHLSLNPIELQLYKIHKAQNNIGWTNFYRGYVTIEFEEMQQRYLKNQGDTTYFITAQAWSKSMAKLVIEHYRTAWKFRCDAIAILNDETLEKRRR